MAEEELFVVPDTNGSEFNKDGWRPTRPVQRGVLSIRILMNRCEICGITGYGSWPWTR